MLGKKRMEIKRKISMFYRKRGGHFRWKSDIWNYNISDWENEILDQYIKLKLSAGSIRRPIFWWLRRSTVLRIQTLLIRIRILLSNLIRIRIQLFDTDPDPYRFKEVMYLKQYFLYIFTSFSLTIGPTGPTQKVFFFQFSLPVNFVVLMRVVYGSGS